MTKAKLGHGKDEMFSLQAQIGTSQKLVHLCGRKNSHIVKYSQPSNLWSFPNLGIPPNHPKTVTSMGKPWKTYGFWVPIV